MDDWLKNGPALTLGTGKKCTDLMDYSCYMSPGEDWEIFLYESFYIILSVSISAVLSILGPASSWLSGSWAMIMMAAFSSSTGLEGFTDFAWFPKTPYPTFIE